MAGQLPPLPWHLGTLWARQPSVLIISRADFCYWCSWNISNIILPSWWDLIWIFHRENQMFPLGSRCWDGFSSSRSLLGVTPVKGMGWGTRLSREGLGPLCRSDRELQSRDCLFQGPLWAEAARPWCPHLVVICGGLPRKSVDPETAEPATAELLVTEGRSGQCTPMAVTLSLWTVS